MILRDPVHGLVAFEGERERVVQSLFATREVQRLLTSGATAEELARRGVGWVVVESGSAPPLALPVAYRGDDLVLYRVGGDQPVSPHRAALIATHLIWLAALAVGAIGMVACALRGRRGGRPAAA